MVENVDNSSGPIKNQKKIIWFLIGLGVVAIILIVSIVLLALNRPSEERDSSVDGGLTPEETEDYISPEEYREYLIANAGETYQLCLQIGEVYDSGEKERALSMYDEELNKSLNEQDFERFMEILQARNEKLVEDNRCDDAVTFYDTVDESRISDDWLGTFYADALVFSDKCGNTENTKKWSDKFDGIVEGDDV